LGTSNGWLKALSTAPKSCRRFDLLASQQNLAACALHI